MVKRLVILILLALAVWAAAVFWPEKADRPQVEAEFTWPDMAVENIDSIGVKLHDQSFMLAAREGGWRVDLPESEPDPKADKEKVVSLIEFISLNKPKRRLGEPEALEDYGLGEPRAAIDISGGFLLFIGADSPDGEGVYASVKGEPEILILPQEYGARLTRKPEHYFDMRLFGLKEGDVKSAELKSGDGESWKISLEGDKYVFKAPADKIGDPVSRQEMDLYLHTLLTARAADLLFEEPRDPLEERSIVELTAKNGSETLSVLASGDNLLGRSDHQPALFRLDPELRDKIMRSAFSLTDRRVLDLDLGKISRFKISRDSRELTAVREESSWKLADGGPEELLGIDMNLWRLTDLRYESEPAASRPEAARHLLTLTLWNKQAEPMAELKFFADPGLPEGRLWISILGDDAYYPVSARLYKDLAGLLPPAEDVNVKNGSKGAE